MRKEIIRTKMEEIKESIGLVEGHLPDKFEEFSSMGLIKDGIYRRVEYAIENVFDICAIINADFELGIPQIDDRLAFGILRENIGDFHEFVGKIEELLEK